ncbi:MAG: elongation factor Ts [Candidatus Cloacimonadota bacterium]|nr:MAG: elongation factor Ts [Candidatus Cloacimonadota bacterium]
MGISAKDVKALREKTQAGMMDCKRALVECDGDLDTAVDFLRKKGLAASGKKAGRIAAEGTICAYIGEDTSTGALFELNCETDFVGKNDAFQALAKNLTKLINSSDIKDVDALMSSKLEGVKVEQIITEQVAKIGEKITPRRFVKYSVDSGYVHSYIHAGGTIGVMVELGLGDASLASNDVFIDFYQDIAMHIAAAAPTYLKRDEVPSAEIDKEIEIYKEQMRQQGKKEEMLEKIALGKVNKYYSEICLLEQPFVKESKTKINQLVKDVSSKIGTDVSINRFQRFVLGEGIEKKVEDFAEEVAKMQS